jgi:hypothetical protein
VSGKSSPHLSANVGPRFGAAPMRFGQTGGMPEADLTGGHVIATTPPTLLWATDQMVETLGPETLKKLKVHAGEHLAAMLTAAFLHTVPMAIDTTGQADLWFDLTSLKRGSIIPEGAMSAAFEIKSMPGPSRKFNSSIDHDLARGIDTIGRSLTIRIQAASDVLREMGPVLRRAGDPASSKDERGDFAQYLRGGTPVRLFGHRVQATHPRTLA